MLKTPEMTPASTSWIKRALQGRRRPKHAPWPTKSEEPVYVANQGRFHATGATRGAAFEDEMDLSYTPITELPKNLYVGGSLNLQGCWRLKRLPTGLMVDGSLNLQDCVSLEELPSKLIVCGDLNLSRCSRLCRLPERLTVGRSLVLDDCGQIKRLPSVLRASLLSLQNCNGLVDFPESPLSSGHQLPQDAPASINLRGCTALTKLPRRISSLGDLDLSGCSALRELPQGLYAGGRLDLSNCTGLRAWPTKLTVNGSIEVAGAPVGTRLKAPPRYEQPLRFTWRGVLVPESIVFSPETIGVEAVLFTNNAELRRVMIERIGLKRFFGMVKSEVIHSDNDKGGKRQLLRFILEGDEPFVCLSVHCPSTGDHYVLRVPPDLRNCRQAAAWVAGFDNPDEYYPLVET